MRLTNIVTFAAFLAVSLHGQTPKRQLEGASIFNEQCIGCHGQDGRAQTEMGKKVKAADLTGDAVQHLSDSQLSKVVKSGKGKMPAFDGKLADSEIDAVIAHVRQLSKKE
jgi:mono/diheme cytochrome c family protein